MRTVYRYLNKLHRRQKGQAIAALLILLAFGGVTVAASLNFTTTTLKANGVVRDKTNGIYAASAGINMAVWELEHGGVVPDTLDESLNGMTVDIDDIDHGIFTMYCGELEYVGELPSHYNWITVNTSAECGFATCNYTVTIYWNGDPSQQRKLTEVGVTLPPGYTYVSGSPAEFPSNLTADEPDETGQAPGGANWIKWTWDTGQGPDIGKDVLELTQTFTIAGSGDIEGDYAWVTAQTGDIGLVGEITGQRHTIIASAVSSAEGKTESQIKADLLLVGGTTYISSWLIMR